MSIKANQFMAGGFCCSCVDAVFKPEDASDRVVISLTAIAHTMPNVLVACLIIGAMVTAIEIGVMRGFGISVLQG